MNEKDRSPAGGVPHDPPRRLDVTRLLFAASLRSRLERVFAREVESPTATVARIERESELNNRREDER